mmetsp:Transcript_15374/g.33323  ORF Transcript_15374/g.33323 Transcript_15374/m.33323 type:complete len:378 (+) Transcript_15374:161-1294(+)
MKNIAGRGLLALMLAMSCVGLTYAGVFSATPRSMRTLLQNGPGNKKLKLGFIGPLSAGHPLQGIGQGIQQAAIAALNATARIDFTSVASDCTAAKAAAGVKTLAARGVQVIIGEICSSATLAAVAEAAKAGVLLISPASTSPSLTGISEWFFRTCPTDSLQASILSQLLSQDKAMKPHMVYANEPYGAGIATALGKILGAGKLTTQAFNESEGFTGPLDLPAGTDALMIATNNIAAAAAIIEAGIAANFTGEVYGSDSLAVISFLEAVGTAADGLKLAVPTTGNDAFFSWFTDVWGYDVSSAYAAQSYDAVTAAIMAWEDANYAKSPARIRDAFKKLSFSGATGPIRFMNGDLMGGAYEILEIKNGTFVEIGVVVPN